MYRPEPGTVPYRVIELLKTKPPGSEMTSRAICREIGLQRHEFGTFAAWMAHARMGGAVECSTKPGSRMLHWRLGAEAQPVIKAGRARRGRTSDIGPVPSVFAMSEPPQWNVWPPTGTGVRCTPLGAWD